MTVFRTMEHQELQNALINTDNNIDEAIQLLSNLSINTSQNLESRIAYELVSRFDTISSRDEAISLTTQTLQTYFQEKLAQKNRLGDSQEMSLSQKIEVLIQDNTILKKAILKMKEKCDNGARLDLENHQLRAELQREKMINYGLRVHLENAVSRENNIEKGPDVY